MISLRKINALLSKQMKTVVYNPFIVVGLFTAPLVAFFMGGSEPDGRLLSLFVQMNVILGGVNTMCVMIAEEKEKFTLNVLKQSTVSGLDFLISNVIFTAVCIAAVSALIYFVLGFNHELLPFGGFMLIAAAASLPAAAIGAIIGMVFKSQMAANTAVIPIMALLLLVPVFMADSAFVTDIMRYIFTEQMTLGFGAIYSGESILPNIGIIAANFAVLAAVFGLFYRKRGLSG